MESEKYQFWGYAAPRPTVDELLAARERLNRAGVEFLKIDLETALTFVHIARQARDESRRKHACSAARKAYDTISNLLPRVHLSNSDSQVASRRLAQLKAELQSLGESF